MFANALSVVVFDGKNALEPKRDSGNNIFTIRRREDALLKCCQIAADGDGDGNLPGIPMGKEQLRKQEIDDKNPNYKTYAFVRLHLNGGKSYSRICH
jgi:hypothetical protein